MIPRLLGEINDKDTQFSAAIKQNQEIIMIVSAIALLVLAYIIFTSFFDKRVGTWRYGICKVFLERSVEYPTNLKILTTAEKQNSAQIGYLVTNAYGSTESQLMECFYTTDNTGIHLSKVTLDRRTYDQSVVDAFNVSIGTILTDKDLNLELPTRLSDTLEDLKYE